MALGERLSAGHIGRDAADRVRQKRDVGRGEVGTDGTLELCSGDDGSQKGFDLVTQAVSFALDIREEVLLERTAPSLDVDEGAHDGVEGISPRGGG